MSINSFVSPLLYVIYLNSKYIRHSSAVCALQKGCVEAYASAKSTCLRMIERDSRSPSYSPAAAVAGSDSDSSEMNAKNIFDRATKGDAAAIEVLGLVSLLILLQCI